jgi:flavodoxin
MLAVVLYRIAGSPAVTGTDDFIDTADGAWYADAVLWASQQGLVGGYGNGLFGTNDPVSREQIATILWRYAGNPAAETGDDFADESSIAAYATTAVDWARINGIVNGKEGNRFDPKGDATRAQVATILMNYTETQQSEPSTDPDSTTNTETKVLVAYFSRYGNTNYNGNVDAVTSASIVVQDGEQQGTTELIARMIAEETGGDLHLIETVDAYPTDFNDVVDQNHQEAADGTRPALTGDIDVSGYDVIFIGYPVWASSTPTPVLSFLESHDLSGKTVIPFCTHNGYGAGNSYSAVAQASTGATVGQGLAIEANDAATSQQTVEDWLDRLELPAHNEQKQGETAIRITIGDTVLEGVLYDSDLACQFVAQLPQTISMSNYGGREVYGSIDQRLTVEGSGQLRFDNGDITYCPSNNTAAIFYAQTDRPDLTMEVYPIGKVTSDLSVFPDLPSRVDITFEVV